MATSSPKRADLRTPRAPRKAQWKLMPLDNSKNIQQICTYDIYFKKQKILSNFCVFLVQQINFLGFTVLSNASFNSKFAAENRNPTNVLADKKTLRITSFHIASFQFL